MKRYILYFVAMLLVVHGILACRADAGEGGGPAVVYLGSAADGAFNGAVHAGVERYNKTTNDFCYEVSAREQKVPYNKLVERVVLDGYNPVIIPYGTSIPSLLDVIKKAHTTRFIVFDAQNIDLPNVFSFVFDEHEGSFLVGIVAAMATKTHTVGFIGGRNLPVIRSFLCGFKQGVQYTNADVKVVEAFVGDEPGAWDDSAAATKLTAELIAKGADVIYQAAGYAGLAALDEIARQGKLAIGVDQNQNHLHPGYILTSMMKRVDKAVFAALMMARRNTWRGNVKHLGLAQGAVELAIDEYNSKIFTMSMRHAVDLAEAELLLGRVTVHDYREGNFCPAW